MKRNVERVALDILVKNERMGKRLKIKIGYVVLCLCVASILVSCGTLRKSSVPSKKSSARLEQNVLTFEQKRKFDYFLLEAVRLKEKGEMDAAFEMYCHCLDKIGRAHV